MESVWCNSKLPTYGHPCKLTGWARKAINGEESKMSTHWIYAPLFIVRTKILKTESEPKWFSVPCAFKWCFCYVCMYVVCCYGFSDQNPPKNLSQDFKNLWLQILYIQSELAWLTLWRKFGRHFHFWRCRKGLSDVIPNTRIFPQRFWKEKMHKAGNKSRNGTKNKNIRWALLNR